MNFGTRIITTTALALLFLPALRADDTTHSSAPAKKSVSAATDVPSVPPENSAPGPKKAPPRPAARSAQAPAGNGSMGRSEHHGRHSEMPEERAPKVELFLGYSYWRAVPYSRDNRIESMNGGSTSLSYNFSHHWGLVADFAGFAVDSLRFNAATGTTLSRIEGADSKVLTFLVGPRYSFRNHSRITPFLQVLGGVAHADEVTLDICNLQIYACIPLPSENAFALTAGGGVDVRVNHRIALRLFQVEYLLTRFADPSSLTHDRTFQNNVRLSTGIVFRFGSPSAPHMNSAPVATCSADKTMVYVGSGDVATVHVSASDADNDPLSFSWTATGGTTDGNGSDVRWNSSGAALGNYSVTVHVDDGRGGTTNCSVDIRVERQPNRPPTIACSTERTPIQRGESTAILASATDPDNDSLTYSYTTSGGRITGSGPRVRFESSGLAGGMYTVKCTVSDPLGATADATTTVEVQEPPSPEIAELETRLSLHSIYFQTARPTPDNPNGGLLESQEKVLVALANDFQKYLTFKPEAHLILGGHADPRGSEAYNQALTERRVQRTKNYLVDHGVPAGSIETKSFGEEDNLTPAEVKQQMQDNPDLTPAERERMLNNLQVIVLANNRRVDVSLSTTGQQSVRRYPFNARDAMALLDTKGVSHRGPVSKRATKK